MFVPPPRVRMGRLRRAAARAREQLKGFLPLVSPYQLVSAASYRAGDMSLMVASNGLLGSAPGPAAPPPPPPTVALPPVGLARLDAKRRDSGDSEARSTHSSSNSTTEEHAPNKIFVGGISFQTTPEKLRAYFAPYGTILDVMVLKDPATNRNRGFGFVTFADIESVNKVLNQEEHMLDGKKIDPKLATPKGQKAAGELLIPRKVFVGGVSQETNSQELLEYFTQFGKVLECSLQMDNNTKRHRGFAFVTYENEENSARVVKKHHHVIKNKTVECKYAQPKETIQATERAKRAQLISVMQSAAAASGPLSPLAAQMQQVQQHYSRVMTAGGPAFSGLSSFRYSPYSVPVAAPSPSLGQQLAGGLPSGVGAMGGPAALSAAALQPTAAAMPYQFANIDVSGLQGLDWSAAAAPLYGMYTA
ncbi:RNA-binding protein Musashi homolog 2-like [Amphibalanus amphitrite]|nr:RNA-binding protein Musashi homolog 2-like isoform X3 [Amphibalanus amphitrite]XP_043192024.1 RNA-binding protein Musashi homolog 2-like isoform X3 [Amphibalanus amphitrite]XP_043246682.1 RNA-binding protein Musashi homolog 2-like [Amphibalanus amphitrite]XP_043246683.1 RNA-binding protein Musashi homolog 2-like [Amphibalanus amphitrite]